MSRPKAAGAMAACALLAALVLAGCAGPVAPAMTPSETGPATQATATPAPTGPPWVVRVTGEVRFEAVGSNATTWAGCPRDPLGSHVAEIDHAARTVATLAGSTLAVVSVEVRTPLMPDGCPMAKPAQALVLTREAPAATCCGGAPGIGVRVPLRAHVDGVEVAGALRGHGDFGSFPVDTPIDLGGGRTFRLVGDVHWTVLGGYTLQAPADATYAVLHAQGQLRAIADPGGSCAYSRSDAQAVIDPVNGTLDVASPLTLAQARSVRLVVWSYLHVWDRDSVWDGRPFCDDLGAGHLHAAGANATLWFPPGWSHAPVEVAADETGLMVDGVMRPFGSTWNETAGQHHDGSPASVTFRVLGPFPAARIAVHGQDVAVPRTDGELVSGRWTLA